MEKTFTCPHCRKQHRLPKGVTPPPNSATHCKKCGRRFQLTEAGSEPTNHEPPDQENTADMGRTQADSESISSALNTIPELRELTPGKFLLSEIFSSDTEKPLPDNLSIPVAKLLVTTAPILNEHLLQKGEQVHRIARGIAYFPFEILYANGLLTCSLNYYALVATNRRLIFINLDCRLSRLGHYVFQVPYADIARVSRGFYGSSLIIKTVAGHTWDFTTVNRRLAKGLEKFIKGQLEQAGASASESPAPAQLCPACFQPVPKKLPSCPHCQVMYKSARIAMKKSLLLPGTGNLYLGNQLLGIIEIIGYLFTWMMTIFLIIVGIPGGFMSGGVLILIYHSLTALLTRRMGEKGYQQLVLHPSGISNNI